VAYKLEHPLDEVALCRQLVMQVVRPAVPLADAALLDTLEVCACAARAAAENIVRRLTLRIIL
jgi:hypothetical protein